MTWPLRPLGDLVAFLDHQRRPVTASERTAGPYPYYGANGQQGKIGDFIFDEELVLLAEDGGHFEAPERGVAYRISGKTWVNNHAHVLRPLGEIDWAYLGLVLQNYDLRSFVSGSTRGKLTKASAGRIPIPLPPLPEQRRIAAILDEADTLRAARQREVDLIDSAVDDRVEAIVASAPTEVLFGDLLAEPLRNGISPSKGGLHQADVLTLSAITHGSFDPRQRKSDTFAAAHSADKVVTEGLHLICRGNGNTNLVGAMVAAPSTMPGVAFPDTMIATRPSAAIKSAALLAAWRSDLVREQIRRSARTTNGTFKINQQTLSAIRVPVGTTSQQIEIEALEHERTRLNALCRRSSDALDTLFASLQHRAFRGEL